MEPTPAKAKQGAYWTVARDVLVGAIFGVLIMWASPGASSWMKVLFGAVCGALFMLWTKRKRLQKIRNADEDTVIEYGFMHDLEKEMQQNSKHEAKDSDYLLQAFATPPVDKRRVFIKKVFNWVLVGNLLFMFYIFLGVLHALSGAPGSLDSLGNIYGINNLIPLIKGVIPAVGPMVEEFGKYNSVLETETFAAALAIVWFLNLLTVLAGLLRILSNRWWGGKAWTMGKGHFFTLIFLPLIIFVPIFLIIFIGFTGRVSASWDLGNLPLEMGMIVFSAAMTLYYAAAIVAIVDKIAFGSEELS